MQMTIRLNPDRWTMKTSEHTMSFKFWIHSAALSRLASRRYIAQKVNIAAGEPQVVSAYHSLSGESKDSIAYWNDLQSNALDWMIQLDNRKWDITNDAARYIFIASRMTSLDHEQRGL